MPSTLYGDLIDVGDTVFDTALGPGVVRFIYEGAAEYPIVVRFNGTREQAYSPLGRTPRFLQATLFWTNPVLIVPQKVAKPYWYAVQAGVVAMVEAMNESAGE